MLRLNITLIIYVFLLSTAAKGSEVSEEAQLEMIMEKIAEGNHRISGNEEHTILIMGNTGAGKTTLAYSLMGKDLQGISNDETGDMVLESVEQIGSMRISHNKTSETKIPNKLLNSDIINKCLGRDGVAIWDCPGFNDTNVGQEIANSFYIKKLYNQHKKLKFILVASEGSLTDRGTLFVRILQQFCNSFNNVDSIKDSTVLVITGVPSRKSSIHLKNTVLSILKDNESLSDEAKKMLGYLAEKIIIFYTPEEEGLYDHREIFSDVQKMAKFVDSDHNLGKFSLSERAIEYCHKLVSISATNLELLVKLITDGIKNPETCVGFTANYFEANYPSIKKWLPVKIDYVQNNEPKTKATSDRFVMIKLIQDLLDEVKKIEQPNQDGLYALIDITKELFTIFENYVPDDNVNSKAMKEKVQHFAYATAQMKEYYKLFSSLIKSDQVNEELRLKLFNTIKTSHVSLVQKLKEAIVNLEINEKINDVSYYNEAINLLSLEQQNEICKNKKAVCLKSLGGIKKQQGQKGATEALKYYIESLKLNNSCKAIYNEIGGILKSLGKYKEAIEFYMVIGNTIEIKSCFDGLLNAKKDYAIYEYCGDKMVILGMFNKAQEYYMDAKSLADDDSEAIRLCEKIAKCLSASEMLAKGTEYTNKAKNNIIYDYGALDLNLFDFNKY